ncbi:hypothetical protein B0F90DRAFT_1819119 [Multifurca ochricompacta]|uniref:HMG box domain-containing protein n=1 Tax=Multifurca ochricompacta TaxID=376703 RepID=A0AAD4M0K1_9AGAM|nr:hypothetical protein B0F90DRAFT_1819119 [Multifurca ochricompacta]
MPAERIRSLKKEKEEVDGLQLTWTDPVESLTAPQQIAFAPAITPGTFTEERPVDSAEPSPSLFPSTLDGTVTRKPGHGKKKSDDHIPRPPNAFILFRSSFIKSRHVSTEVETNHSTLSKIIGLTWQNMPHEERQFWHSKAKVAQVEHKLRFPDYAFRPTHVKSKGAAEKRKVREVGPKDMKRCAKIAQLLVEGKKGADLQAAVEEFDKNHVPTIVTRFDTPITARSFRRSLSEPAPDTDPSVPAFLRSDAKSSSRRLRATSSQPTMSRPSTPEWRNPSSPFGNLAEGIDSLPDTTWNDMPPLVLPPVGSADDAFITKDVPSLDFNTFVFHEAPATCIQSIDPLSPSPNNELYGAFHTETPVSCAPGPFTPSLAIDMSFLESLSPSSFPSSPCTPISYSGGQFSPVEAVPAPPTAFDPYNMMAQFDSCGSVGFDPSQGVTLPATGLGDSLVHVPHPQHPYSDSKGSFSFLNSHKFPVPEMTSMDISGFAEMFVPSAQSFSF